MWGPRWDTRPPVSSPGSAPALHRPSGPYKGDKQDMPLTEEVPRWSEASAVDTRADAGGGEEQGDQVSKRGPRRSLLGS